MKKGRDVHFHVTQKNCYNFPPTGQNSMGGIFETYPTENNIYQDPAVPSVPEGPLGPYNSSLLGFFLYSHCLGKSYYVNILGGLGSNEFHIKRRFDTHDS